MNKYRVIFTKREEVLVYANSADEAEDFAADMLDSIALAWEGPADEIETTVIKEY